MQAENDEEALKEEPHVEFTGEEGYGRYLDLHQLFQLFVNSKFSGQLQEKASKADASANGSSSSGKEGGAAAGKKSESREIVISGDGNGAQTQQPLDYMGYIATFANLGAVPKQHKGSSQYRWVFNTIRYFRSKMCSESRC